MQKPRCDLLKCVTTRCTHVRVSHLVQLVGPNKHSVPPHSLFPRRPLFILQSKPWYVSITAWISLLEYCTRIEVLCRLIYHQNFTLQICGNKKKMQAALQRQFIQIQASLRVYNKVDCEIAMVKTVCHHFHKFVQITFISIAKHSRVQVNQTLGA